MTIVIEDYNLIQQGSTFDLIWLKPSASFEFVEDKDGKKTRKEKEETQTREVTLGYNMSLSYCMKKIVYNNLNNKDLKVSLLEWTKLWQTENDRIYQIFKQYNLV